MLIAVASALARNGSLGIVEGSAMCVGLRVVRLKYGLYIAHLSKWFGLVLMFNLLSSVQWLHCLLRLPDVRGLCPICLAQF